MSKYRGKIVVDFDGTICEHAFPDVGPPTPGVAKALQDLRDMGFYIVVHSCRTSGYWDAIQTQDVKDIPDAVPGTDVCPNRQAEQFKIIVDFMEKHNIPYDEIYGEDKPVALAYIDDRGIEYRGNKSSWPAIVERLRWKLCG